MSGHDYDELYRKPAAWKNMKKAIGQGFGIADLMVELESVWAGAHDDPRYVFGVRQEMAHALWHWVHDMTKEQRSKARRSHVKRKGLLNFSDLGKLMARK